MFSCIGVALFYRRRSSGDKQGYRFYIKFDGRIEGGFTYFLLSQNIVR